MSTATKHLEVITHTHKGIEVVVQIDYDNGQISLVEQEKGSLPIRYKGKQWVFAHRPIEYMKSWEKILDAMMYAVRAASVQLKLHLDEQDKKRDVFMARVVDEVIKKK